MIKINKSLYCIIILGIILAIVGVVLTAFNTVPRTVDVINYISLIIQLGLGIAIVEISRKLTHLFFHFFIGLVFIFWSLLGFAITINPWFTSKELWPIYGVLAAVAIFISGLLKYRSMKFGYVIPSATLFGMGLWYFLFSMKIIKMSFKSIAATLGPLFMLSIAVFLVLFFLVQQRHKELIFSDEETGTFSDEEVSFKSDMEED